MKDKLKKITVSFYPNSEVWNLNLYYPQLQTAIIQAGCNIIHPKNNHLDFNWLYKNRSKINVLHFHWIQYHYSLSKGSSSTTLIKFIAKLILARIIGYKLVWTFHNTLPHERIPGKADIIARFAISHLAHSIIVHCEKAKAILKNKFYRRKSVFYVPHGSYPIKVFSENDKFSARTSLKIKKDQLVFSHIGNIRPYKNIGVLIEQFLRVAQPNWLLLITGKAKPQKMENELRSLSKNDPRIIFNFSFIDEQELLNLLSATDISVFSFKNILCSGSAIESMSAGLPIIAPAIGCLEEWITNDLGILYDPDNINTLGDAMSQITQKDLINIGENSRNFVHNWKWEDIGNKTKSVYSSYNGKNS